jgi:hypothetical protein
MNFWYVHCISGSATGCFNYLHIRLRQEFRMEEPKKGSKFMQTSATSQLVLSCLFRCVISAPDLLLRLTFVKLLTIICLSSPNYVFSSNHHKYTTRFVFQINLRSTSQSATECLNVLVCIRNSEHKGSVWVNANKRHFSASSLLFMNHILLLA